MYTRKGSQRLIRSSMFWSSSNWMRSRLKAMVPSATGAQTNSQVGMMPSSATSMPKASSLNRTMYWPVLRFRPTKPLSWSAAWQMNVEVVRMVNLMDTSLGTSDRWFTHKASERWFQVSLCRGNWCGQGYCKAAWKCVGKICFAQVYVGMAIAPTAFSC
ncbi:hypothetical protein D3C76_1247350 [compost metagenome]